MSRNIIISLHCDNTTAVFSEVMEKRGYRVVEQRNASWALKALEQFGAEVALVVIHSIRTEEKVEEYAPRLKAAAPAIPVVVHTGDPRFYVNRDLTLPGVDRIFPKLDDWKDTFAALEKLMGNPS